MKVDLYVDAAFSLLNEVSDEQQNLIALIRELTGEKLRRVDRFTLLALAGAIQCGDKSRLASSAGMILTSSVGALSTTVDMMHKIGIENVPPKPFQFVNSLGNSACYSLSKMLGVTGPSLAVAQEQSSFESGLEHASLMLEDESVPQVLVGGIDEAPLPIDLHLRRHGAADNGFTACYEGAHWLRLSSEPCAESFAKIELLGRASSRGEAEALAKSALELSTVKQVEPKWFDNYSVQQDDAHVMKHGTFSGHRFVQACEYVRDGGGVAVVVSCSGNAKQYKVALVQSPK